MKTMVINVTGGFEVLQMMEGGTHEVFGCDRP